MTICWPCRVSSGSRCQRGRSVVCLISNNPRAEPTPRAAACAQSLGRVLPRTQATHRARMTPSAHPSDGRRAGGAGCWVRPRGVAAPPPCGEAGSNVRSSTAEREPRTSVLWPARHGRYEKCHQAATPGPRPPPRALSSPGLESPSSAHAPWFLEAIGPWRPQVRGR